MHPTAEKLLELQIRHELNRLTKGVFLQDVAEFVGDLYQLAENLTLNEVMSTEQIMGVIKRNVVELEIHGGIIELVGEAVAEVRAHSMRSETTLGEVLDRHSFEEYVNKVFDLFQERDAVIRPILETPVYTQILSDILLAVLSQYFRVAHKRSLTIPLVGDLLNSSEKLFSKLVPELNLQLEESVKHFSVKNIKWLISKSQSVILEALSDQELRENVLDAWDDISHQPVGQFDETIQSLDLNEFVVIGFEHWKRFRTTDFFYQCCEIVVRYLFDKYGDEPLSVLLGDMGISQAQIVKEIQELAPPALEALIANGFIEGQLRKRLSRFYASTEVTALFDASAAG